MSSQIYAMNEKKLFRACEDGDLQNLRKILDHFQFNIHSLNNSLFCACKNNHLNIIEYLQTFDKIDINQGLFGASFGGHESLVNDLMAQGANHYLGAFMNAIKGGHLDLVKFFFKQIPSHVQVENYVYHPLFGASLRGYDDIVEFLISECGCSEFDHGLLGACYGGFLHLIERMIKHGGRMTIGKLIKTAANGHLHVIQYVHQLRSFSQDEQYYTLESAAANDRLFVVEYLLTFRDIEIINRHTRANLIPLKMKCDLLNRNPLLFHHKTLGPSLQPFVQNRQLLQQKVKKYLSCCFHHDFISHVILPYIPYTVSFIHPNESISFEKQK